MSRSCLLAAVFLLAACGEKKVEPPPPSTRPPACDKTPTLFTPPASYTPSGAPAYLMGVLTRPTGPSASGGTQDYQVQLPAGFWLASPGHGAAPPSPSLLARSPAWQARLAHDRARVQQIDAVIADLQAGRRHRVEMAPRDGCATACDASQNQMCWKGACTSTPTLQFVDGTTPIAFRVVGVYAVPNTSMQINVLLDAASSKGAEAAVDAVAYWADTWAKELILLGQSGHQGDVDRDGDGRMTVALTDSVGNSAATYGPLAGFFSVSDFLPAGTQGASGNEADVLWARVPGSQLSTGTQVTAQMVAGTLAHEYTHLVSYGVRVHGPSAPLAREELWLDEALAHTMEDLTGWGVASVRIFEAALSVWDRGPFASGEDSPEQRGRAYTLLRALIDQQARIAGATDAASPAAEAAATQVVSTLIHENALGFEHGIFASLSDAGLFEWLTALFATGDPQQNRPEAHAYDYLPVALDAMTRCPVGFNPRGAYYDPDGLLVTLEGPRFDELDATSSNPQGLLDESASALFFASGFDPTLATLTDPVTPAGPFLHTLQVAGAP